MLSENSIKELHRLKAGKVFVQIPEGLKTRALELSGFLGKKGFDTVISVEPCFGACDLRDHEARRLGCDALLHIGHTDFGLSPLLPVVYDEWPSDFDPVSLLRKHIKKIDYGSIGLLATAQHLDSLDRTRRFLESMGRTVLIGKGRGVRDGQVLGCNYSSAKSVEDGVDCFIFIGSGTFHLSGLVERTSKPVFSIDAEKRTLSKADIDSRKQEVRRQLRIEKARGMRNFGIYVSTKPGQVSMKAALELRKKLQAKGKKTFIISADMLTPEKILGMGIEVLVNTACPRIYEDQVLFGIPVLDREDIREL